MIQYDFAGRVALVVGGTSGIGLAIARGFVAGGAKVVVAARGESAGRAVEKLLPVRYLHADVLDEASLAAAVQETVRAFGRLDFAANCAGHGGDGATLETTNQAVWDTAMAVNARGTWLAMRHEVPAMLASGGGAIVNLSAIYGMAGKKAHHAYVASKHAVIGMTRSVALEFADRNLRVNALCAGVTRTPAMAAFEAAAPELVGRLVAEHPIGRMATEEEIAAAALWLCSDASSYVTGAPIAVDGGFLAA
jgi:NAD(P)-dependent dehydrogenase (short-subunit alcohol dehydrogenase family)